MPSLVALAGGFATAITGGAVAFGAPTAAFAAGVAAASFATSTLGTVLITGALVLGAQLLAPGDVGGANSSEVRGSVRQAVPIQRVLYGYGRIGGALFFHDDSKPPYLVWGLLHSARRITAVDQVYVATTPVGFDSLGRVTTDPYLNGSDVRLRWSFRDGDPDQAIDPLLASIYPDLPSTFRQRGTATSVFMAKFGDSADDFARLWGAGTQIPNMLIEARGAGVHDPRVPASDADNEASWPFSNNAALVQADWLRQPYGGRYETSRIRWDEVADAANFDDELVGLKGGGFQKRHTIDGVITLSGNPSDIAEQFLTANRGFIASDQGRMWVTSSKPTPAITTITDDDLRGGFVFQRYKRKDGMLNTVRTRFVAPDREYEMADGPVYTDAGLVAEDGEELVETLSLPFTPTHQRAQRLAKMALDMSRLQRALTTALTFRRGIGLRPGMTMNIQSARFPIMNGLYRVESIGWTEDYNQRPLTLIEYDPAIVGNWIPETHEKDFVLSDVEGSITTGNPGGI